MTEPESAPGSGERIGAYEIQSLLGRGGMGEVFLAWDARLRRRVAIKRIRHDHGVNPALRQRLLREARAAAGLSHPSIVQVYDLIEEDTGACIVLEHVEGRTLAATLAEDGPLEPATATRLAREIADGLAAAHAAGIVHRDLKPENVIVTPAGHAKILDFGLAQIRRRTPGDPLITQHGVLLGTFHMMSPEQASGARTDERSDLFSLGVLLYEMLTGRSPFRGANPTETLKRVLSEEPPRVDVVRPGIPARLGDLIEHLLAKEPEDRPAGAEEVIRQLEAVAASLASPTAPTLAADRSTIVDVPGLVASRPVPAPLNVSSSTVGLSIPGHPGWRKMTVSLLTVAVLGAVLSLAVRLLLNRGGPEAPVPKAPLRVLVLQSQENSQNERLRLAASAVLDTSLRTLGSLERVEATDKAQLPGGPATAREMTQAAAANELLVGDLEEEGGQGKVTLIRRTAGGRELGKATVTGPIDSRDLLQLAKDVEKKLLLLYPDRPRRAGFHPVETRPEAYAEFLAVKRRIDSGAVPSQEDVDRLQGVMDESVYFPDAHLIAADALLNRFQSTRRIAYLDKALNLVQSVCTATRNDARPLITRFAIEMAQDDTKAAEIDLQRIDLLLPDDDPRFLLLRSNLEEREGLLEKALNDLKRVVDSAPSWRNLSALAKLEARTGDVKGARGDLQRILNNSSDNMFALDGLARIELLYGDLRQAERRYRDLIKRSPTERAYYTNLGSTLFLQGRNRDALRELKKALKIDPDHVDVMVDLAEVEDASGLKKTAREHFRKALREIGKNSIPENRLAEAECLAYLRQKVKVVETIQLALREKQDDPDVLKSAALVSALAGDHITALTQAKKSILKGVQPRWFRLPAYRSLQNDPEFRALFSNAPGAL